MNPGPARRHQRSGPAGLRALFGERGWHRSFPISCCRSAPFGCIVKPYPKGFHCATMPGKTDLSELNCSLARTLEIVGDWWTLLIIRDAVLGVRRFGDFQKSIGIAKNILAT